MVWFWHHVFVAGAINLLIGMPDQGKGCLTCDLAARKTRGTPWPLGEDRTNEPGLVAIVATEDTAETTIVPRLREAGADMKKVLIVDGVRRLNDKGEPVKDTLDISEDVQSLEQLRQENPDLSLVILDPLDDLIGQGRRRVLHAPVRREAARGNDRALPGPRLRPLLRLRRHVRPVDEVRERLGAPPPGREGRHRRLHTGLQPETPAINCARIS